MRTQLTIRLDIGDMADPRRLADAYNLVGGATEQEKAESRKRRDRSYPHEEHEHKPFGRIAGNDFTMEDVRQAVETIKRRRDNLIENLDDPVFLSPNLQQTWADGVRANAEHAVRLAEEFMENLKEDLNDPI